MNSHNIISIINIFNNKIEKAQYLKKIIKNLVEKGDLDKAEVKINEYNEMFPDDVEINSIKMVMSIMKGDMDIAEQCALKGLEKTPFNFDLNYNLGFLYQIQKRCQEAVNSYITAKRVAINEEEKKIIQDKIDEIKQLDKSIDFSKDAELSYKLFPLKTNDTTWIGKTLFKTEDGEGYIPLYYNEPLNNYPTQLWNFYKTETLRGKIYDRGEVYVNNSIKIALPLAVLENNTSITITTDTNEYKLDYFIPNRFYYIPITSKDKIKLESNSKFIIGKPVSLGQKKTHDVKIALCLFIDGLSQEIINKYSIEKLMPNTYKFFKKGTIFNNCYSNAEWTLASVPSIFSGKYQIGHKIFHPELPHIIGDGYKIISEYFQDHNYLTFQCCGNWRKTPSYGYVKGFDRTIYHSATIGSKTEDVISSFLEQVRAFEDRDQFIWLSFFELHNIADNITSKISNQIINGIDSRTVKKDDKKSVVKDYDENKVEQYINEINRIDYYLKIIFDFIEDKYNNDEIVIALLSDHGQSYLDEGVHILRDSRTRVPLMMRGRGIPAYISDELIENVDILPTILNKCLIEYNPEKIDGMIPRILGGEREKEYVYSESIYPGKTYKAVIRDNKHTFIFESENDVQQDGRIVLGDFSIRLENSLTRTDETNENFQKVARYFDIVISHVSKFLKI